MALSCGGNFLRFLVFFFNAIVFIGGGVIAGFGIYLLVETNKSGGTVSMVLPAFITAFGLLLFLIGFMGCFGACYNNPCMLKTFAAIVGILLIAEIICGIVLLAYRHDFVRLVGEKLKEAIKGLGSGSLSGSDPTLKALYELQMKLNCCGGTGPGDWSAIPPSCCGRKTGSCTHPFKTGCAEAMYNEIKDSALVFGIIIIVIGLIQVGAIICAACLAKKVGEYEKV
ncbi:Leukocyte surface antigen CD53 [Echinococcus granulosus]|uniref:Tetraspanin n=1 Tax=Echinococcus granulosus TaxID=6210 RepID=U6J3W8_ECHGR|nr:Leukocyte surface antigen CD53 [Echinococcus granulosus]EUB60810.1 Leukocyte surface antigen CD53 [Echinococcus granulosus]KAH9283921.1 Leukocyte surface antigen CD53 [Echinococcus granulosus]CDS17979.1 TSP5 [Echinococcus granulosus]